jgi:hypothetical protein
MEQMTFYYMTFWVVSENEQINISVNTTSWTRFTCKVGFILLYNYFDLSYLSVSVKNHNFA